MSQNREELWRPRVTAEVIGVCDRQLRNLEAEGRFPKRFLISPGGRAKAHLKSEVLAWIRERAASRPVVALSSPRRKRRERKS